MRNPKDKTVPGYLRFCTTILEVLRELGGSGTAAEVVEAAVKKLGIGEEEQSEVLKNGTSRVENQVHWARFYLAKAGYLDSSKYGIWTLTQQGFSADLSNLPPSEIYKQATKKIDLEKVITTDSQKNNLIPGSNSEAPRSDGFSGTDYRAQLLDILGELSPGNFERLCQRLLREAGFEQVVVTGRSGDGGIDGSGVLRISSLVTFKVLFQCKRYKGSVTAPQVRDFQGAMAGRADKGIILTTGSFTADASREARRDGAPPVELVDSEKLVALFESLELGLKPVRSFEVDPMFFQQFRDG